ncbi:mxaA protein [Ancylobacter sp. 3268]|uniref:nonribosomal peptide synthetase MxaA n=1 Tax=Ancylobacter sp. 3268 TaxID=2817752 RepID=UPI002864AB45|nr:nonribosomal peptide synthetase MxaA [Ancylobacter sp. 3268]MDR6954819.1 mxaA protein [Ancylobacter sp. 3268]
MAALVVVSVPAGAQLRSVELYAPRPFGHVIGDTLVLSADIVLDAPFRLDPASLPRARPLNYWLELVDVRLTDRGTSGDAQRYTLDLTYQTFYAPLEPKRLDIPPLQLVATDGTRRLEFAVPRWSFLTSPLREIVSTGQGATMALRPDAPPRPIPVSGTLRSLLVALGCGLAALVVLAWQAGWGPFARRRGRPFAQAARAVRAALASSKAPPSSPAYRQALLSLHRAFDATAGKGVFAEDLPGFFSAHPGFVLAETEIRRLFAASRRLFFGDDLVAATRELPPAELLALAGRLKAVERGGR